MVETDLEGVITYATKPFSKISGYSRKELIGKNINLLKHPDVSQEFFQTEYLLPFFSFLLCVTCI